MSKYKHVCFVENLYTLLLYLLKTDVDFQEETFFFFTPKVPQKIRKQFKNYYCFKFPESDIRRLPNIIWLRISKLWKFPFLKDVSFWGQDNLPFTSPLLGYHKMILLEDGVMNYTLTANRKFGMLKGLIGGPLMSTPPFGLSKSVKEIILTGIGVIPDEISDKVVIVNLKNLWLSSSIKKQEQILSVFGLNRNIIEEFNNVESVLFTQPLSEDGVLEEKTKIDLYKQILKNEPMAIKPHPRELTDYIRYFPDVTILESIVPIELLSLIGIKFKKTYTIFSTAVLSFPYETEVHFLGTSIHPDLVEKFGNIYYENGKVVKER